MNGFGPDSRRLRVYSFDPSLASNIATWGINETTIEIPWECDDQGSSTLKPGPVGEYVEVVDFDPASGLFYKPINLDEATILAQDGVRPNESDPQFHQQMVYAVAMATIDHFEKAFGRKALWSNQVIREPRYEKQFVRRLRIYPHALRARNAFYSPNKKALLFGYFPVTSKDENNTPGTTVFTCLSHDVIVHEMCHALLDGIHPRFREATNPDVHAFHEAFSDIVSIFQRFSYEGVLESQISRTRGDLARENMLAQLAQQFGRATGRGTALRDALGGINRDTGVWEVRKPDPRALENVYEPHARGAILVAAVFRAFTLVYGHRVADLFRLSTGGTGVLPDGEIHPDLVGRLAQEARQVAARIVRMCIRGLDYLPPVDLTFGDYLRAIVTADRDVNRSDPDGCRVAFVQSFREWGISPAGVRSMSVDALIWDDYQTAGAKVEVYQAPHPAQPRAGNQPGKMSSRALEEARKKMDLLLKKHKRALKGGYKKDDEDAQKFDPDVLIERKVKKASRGKVHIKPIQPWDERLKVWQAMQDNTYPIWRWLNDQSSTEVARALNLILNSSEAPRTVYRNRDDDPTVEVHSVRPILRRRVDMTDENWLVVEVTQRRRGYFSAAKQEEMDQPGDKLDRTEVGDFTYRAGSTFFINPATLDIEWVMKTPGTITNNDELGRLREYFTGSSVPQNNAFDGGHVSNLSLAESDYQGEPFALLHEHDEE